MNMENERMSTKDMLQYCDEALAWEEFGPVDIFFFESVKRILLGQCSAIEEPEVDELAGVSEPVSAQELIDYASNGQVPMNEGFFEEGKDYTLTGKESE